MNDGMHEYYLDLAHSSGWNKCAECPQWLPVDQMIEHDGHMYCPTCAPDALAPSTGHKYFLMLRPPGYAQMPDGHTAFDGGMPKHTWVTDDGRQLDAFGWVEYPEPLPLERIWRFDLEPNDPAESAHLFFWLMAGRDEEDAAAIEEDYITAYRTDRAKFEHYNRQYLPYVQALVAAEDDAADAS